MIHNYIVLIGIYYVNKYISVAGSATAGCPVALL